MGAGVCGVAGLFESVQLVVVPRDDNRGEGLWRISERKSFVYGTGQLLVSDGSNVSAGLRPELTSLHAVSRS